MSILPQQSVPPLQIETVHDGIWDLQAQSPDQFTMLVFYRGLHCPICKDYLSTLKKSLDALKEQGVEAIAISSDSKERAKKAAEEWKLKGLKIGFEFPLHKANEWGLFVSGELAPSKSKEISEPPQFLEPGLFLVDAGGKLYASSVQSMPFARPPIDGIVKAVTFIREKAYPARGQAIAL